MEEQNKEKQEWWDKNWQKLYDIINTFTVDEWCAFVSRKQSKVISMQNSKTQASILFDKLTIDELNILLNDYSDSLE